MATANEQSGYASADTNKSFKFNGLHFRWWKQKTCSIWLSRSLFML